MSYIGSKPADKALTGADIEDGTVQIADLAATGTKDATTFLRGDGTFASAGEANTPAFYAYISSPQTVGDSSFTKVQINEEVFDTDGCYDNVTNYRFTPTTAGKYYLFAQAMVNNLTNDVMNVSIYKNGSTLTFEQSQTGTNDGTNTAQVSTIDTANGTTDYYEVFVYQDSGATKNISTSATNRRGFLGGYRIIE
jgi:hypothetical protein